MRNGRIEGEAMAGKLGILMLSEPESPDLQTIQGLCQAATEMDVEVEVFVMGDAVYDLLNSQLATMAREGAKVTFCAANVTERDIDLESPALVSFEEGSQYTLACIVESSDRFLAFT
jgi:sulfur relay (sulfurtransferase) complex TusBCD TusD component (DsrE family)